LRKCELKQVIFYLTAFVMLFFLPPITMAVSSLVFRELYPLLLSLPAEEISSTPDWYPEFLFMAAAKAEEGSTMALPDVTT
jgi:hypothetical protein